jgi:uncharacterized protein
MISYRREVTVDSRIIKFQSGSFSLVGAVYIPEGEGACPAVVVCHPHPLYGGSMDNNVVDALCEALAAKAMVALKFNFRGVEGSEGKFSVGSETHQDVRAALSFLISFKEVDAGRIGLAGYSAGAAWGLAAVYRDERVKALAAISPPLALFDFSLLKECRKPKLMISGSDDQHVYEEDLRAVCRELPEPTECDIIEDADHSWWGYETELADKVAGFFKATLSG